MDKVNLPYSIVPSGRSWRDKKLKNRKDRQKKHHEKKKKKDDGDEEHIIDRRV
ncbi:MAG: hypothetical protein GF417_00740 [Candidatus Latescibacteria bacterium]|jgi:hypothetical protein|nr:hypothetical protein [bacterium]MBD3422953.1 hypothetical protein [Candidatus Latescibacterota bacterium]